MNKNMNQSRISVRGKNCGGQFFHGYLMPLYKMLGKSIYVEEYTCLNWNLKEGLQKHLTILKIHQNQLASHSIP